MEEFHIKVSAHELRMLFAMAAKFVRESLEKHLEAAEVDLTSLQFGIMRTLETHEQTLSDLSRHLMLDPSTLVPVIDSLERKGYVRREKDPNDRRRSPLIVTPEGVQVLETVRSLHFPDSFSAGVEKLGAEQTAQLIKLLHALLDHMPGGGEITTLVTANVSQFRERHHPPSALPRHHQPSQDDPQ